MKVLYLDCFSGVSGDMLLGALVGLGVPPQEIEAAIAAVPGRGATLNVGTTSRGPLAATKVDVTVPDDAPVRKVTEILALVEGAALPPGTRSRASKAFEILGGAEARVHGVAFEDAHLHEAGALDAIADIVGVCSAVEHLSVDRIVCSVITTGRGWVSSEHGRIPVPAPAVLEILKDAGIPVVERGSDELVTPTGAALVAALADASGEMPAMTVQALGYGAGARELDHPNVVRAIIGEAFEAGTGAGQVSIIEANIDDMTPELFPHVVDGLITAGAQDAWVTPIIMKKGRPAVTLSALVKSEDLDRVMDVLYRETTTLGLRIVPVLKDELDRGWIEVEVFDHAMRVKFGTRAGQIVTISPEYEEARAVARQTGHPLKDVMAEALRAAREKLPAYK
jgi:pyridinium-3,5-bisthiocarboxylic acid mononucleotide nickel chelatase